MVRVITLTGLFISMLGSYIDSVPMAIQGLALVLTGVGWEIADHLEKGKKP